MSLCVFLAGNPTVLGNLPLDFPVESQPQGTPPTQGYLTSDSRGPISLPSPHCSQRVSGGAASTWSQRGMSSGPREAGTPEASERPIRWETDRGAWLGVCTWSRKTSVSGLARNTLYDFEYYLNFRALMSNCEWPCLASQEGEGEIPQAFEPEEKRCISSHRTIFNVDPSFFSHAN